MLQTKEIIKRFKLKISNEDNAEIEREIRSASIHRLGLELVDGVHHEGKEKAVIGWGTKEYKYLSTLDKEERIKKLRRVVNANVPLIILSIGFGEDIADEVEEICNTNNIPLVRSEDHLSVIIMTIGWFMVKRLAKSEDVHGSLVVVNGVGVMITGKSGIGKSEAVLELVQRGSSFVSDDTVVIKRIGTDFIGESAPLTKNFLEARGIGIIDIPKIYGLKSTKDSVNIDLVIELLPSSDLHNVDRLGNKQLKFEVLGGQIDKIQIPVENGRTLSALVEAAVNVYIARIHGHDPLDVISERNK